MHDVTQHDHSDVARRPRFGVMIRSPYEPAAEAIESERLGFDFVAAGERISLNVPVTNSFMALAAAAGVTSRVALLSAITLTPVYPPVLLAKLAAALDALSGGRFEIGLGVGGDDPDELEACGVSVTERGARTNEAIQVARRLWAADGPSEFSGRFTSYKNISMEPRPVQGDVPIWVTGRSNAAIKRASTYQCNWLPNMLTANRLASSLETFPQIGDHVPQAGILLWTAIAETEDKAREKALKVLFDTFRFDFSNDLDRLFVVGTPATAERRIREYIDAGASTLLFAPCTETAAELKILRETLANQVLPQFGLPAPA
jgi:alkanesulfonate monooxygenase SsuD/methylene tetrahydromethanopterin reductase-like flavin-dependent oxidoreductase (luciferase family)